MMTEQNILIRIAVLELELSHALKHDVPNHSYILGIQTQIDTLNWVLKNN